MSKGNGHGNHHSGAFEWAVLLLALACVISAIEWAFKEWEKHNG